MFFLKHYWCLAFFILLNTNNLYSQECNFILFGTIKDANSKEVLPGASIKLIGAKQQTITEVDGHYHLESLCNQLYTIEISFIGFDTKTQKVNINGKTELNINLFPNPKALNEVVITREKIKETTVQTRSVLSGMDLEQTKGLSLGEALKKIPGLSSLQTGPSISKPAIHGMHSNRVLIYNAGVRQEGQQWGAEHAPEIDPLIANQIIVLKGASAVAYGSDAIAGVILVEPQALSFGTGTRGAINLIAGTNNRQGLANLNLENAGLKSNNWAYRAYFTSQVAGNSKTPNYYLKNTGYNQVNGAFLLGYQKNKLSTELYASTFNSNLGVFSGAQIGSTLDLQNSIDGIRPIPRADFSYEIGRPYQSVTHNIIKFKSFYSLNPKSKLALQYSFQQNNREEFDQVRGAADKSYQLRFELSTHNLDFHLEHKIGENIAGKIGTNTIVQQNFYDGRFLVPFFNSIAPGVYVIEKYTKKNFQIEAGLRYDYKYMKARLRENPRVQTSPEITPEFNFSQVSASLGANYQLNSALLANATISKGWRPPSINELFSYGTHQGSGTFEVGDKNLTQESAYNFAAGIKKEQGIFTFDVSGYYNLMNNYIYLKPGKELVLTVRGAYPSFNYVQVDARFSGIDFSAAAPLIKNTNLLAKYSTVRAYDRNTGTHLEFIPSDKYSLDAIWNIPGKGKIRETTLDFGVSHTARQSRVLQTQDYSPTPPAYTLFSFDARTNVYINKRPIGFSLTALNLTNKVYRDYLNRFRYYADDVGRNFILRVQIPI
ncbi:MAG: TonB-dependent receptor [Oligoflexus sp.]|nr:TonB-dependent receptor [Pseudopedobacter sp.]